MRIGLDIGGSTTAAVLLDEQDEAVARVRLPSGYGPNAVLDAAATAVAQVCTRAGVDGSAVASVGVGVPGTVDVASGAIRNAVNLGITSLDLGRALAARLGVPVQVENDVNAAAKGAWHLLAAQGMEPSSMAYLNLGTGLACGVVLYGELWRGATGVAGEIGHVPVDPQGTMCACGQRGCLETLCSGSAVERLWPATDVPPAAALFAAAAAGDPAALAVQQGVHRGVAATVRLIALSFDVETVVLGGGLSNLGQPLLLGVHEALVAMAARSPFLAALDLPARVVLLERPGDAPTLGAALVAQPVVSRA